MRKQRLWEAKGIEKSCDPATAARAEKASSVIFLSLIFFFIQLKIRDETIYCIHKDSNIISVAQLIQKELKLLFLPLVSNQYYFVNCLYHSQF